MHQHVNDTDEVQVRLSYSNSGLLDLLGVHVVDEREGLDPNRPLERPRPEKLEVSARGETIEGSEARRCSPTSS